MKNLTSKKKMNINIHSARETGTERYITVARRKQYFSESAIIKAISASLFIYQMYVLNQTNMGIKMALVAIFAKTLYFLVSSGVWILYFDKSTFVTKSERKVIKKRRFWLFVSSFIALLAYIGVTASKYFLKFDKGVLKDSSDNDFITRSPPLPSLKYNDVYNIIYAAIFILV